MNAWLVVAIALLFVGMAGYAIATGEAQVGRRGTFRFRVNRAESPAGFWVVIAVYITIAVMTIVVGWPKS